MALKEMDFEKTDLNDVLLGSPIAQCPTCKRVFSTVSNADEHRVAPKGSKQPFLERECVFPPSVGLRLNKYGIYVGGKEFPSHLMGRGN